MNIKNSFLQNKPLMIIVAMVLIFVELYIFFIFSAKSGTKHTLQVLNDFHPFKQFCPTLLQFLDFLDLVKKCSFLNWKLNCISSIYRLSLLLSGMSLEYQNKKKEVIVSDDSWSWTFSPLVKNSLYHGETYDAAATPFFQYYPIGNGTGTVAPGGFLTFNMN